MPNPKSRHYALRQMYAARRRLLEVMKREVWRAHTETPTDSAILTICRSEEARDASCEAYYLAREMAHWAFRGSRKLEAAR